MLNETTATQTLIPTCSFRWFVSQRDGAVLQQRFQTPGGKDLWIDVPRVEDGTRPI